MVLPVVFLLNSVIFAHAYTIQSIFWDQGLTDDAFNHNECVKQELAAALCSEPPCTAVILGVEYGREVFEIIEAGFSVVGVEPIPKFAEHFLKTALEKDLLNKVTFWQAAAGAEVGSTVIRYSGLELEALVIPVDSLIKSQVEVLSVDVHGESNNFDVLKGAKNALEKGLVKSVWVEMTPAPWSEDILELLDQSGFLLFDFRFIGTSIKCAEDNIPPGACQHRMFYNGNHPGSKDWYQLFAKLKATSFQWLQTDVVAIHSSFYNHALETRLKNLSQTCAQSLTKLTKTIPFDG